MTPSVRSPRPTAAAVLAVAVLSAVFAPAPPAASAPRGVAPVRLSPAEADSVAAAHRADRAETLEWLEKSPTSYLATVSREDFGARTSLTVGSDGDNAVRLQAPGVMPHHLLVTVVGDSFDVRGVDPGATFRLRGRDTTSARVPPTNLQLDRFTVRLSHQRYPAIIVFDPRSPRFAQYKGLAWYPVDLRWRFVAPLTPNPAADTTVIQSTRGNLRRAIRVGWFDLRMAGRSVRLEAHRLLEPGIGENDMSVFFRDATTGRETYAVGRYLDPVRLPDGRWLLDFNSAYNPACAVSDHYNCPIPSRANTLPVAVRAGEMDAHYH